MNLKEIREECWAIAREVSTIDSDRLWTTKEMNRYVNRTDRYIARETRCIKDAVTAEICRITCTPILDPIYGIDPNSWLYGLLVIPQNYALDARILDIDEVKWTSRSWRLNKSSVKKWQINPYWEQVAGMATEFCTDYTNNMITINYRDTTADVLKLVVRRLPLADLSLDADIPEIRIHYHDYFINGVLEQMYMKQDVETFDLAKAEMYKAAFLKNIDEIKQQESLLDDRLRPNLSLAAFR